MLSRINKTVEKGSEKLIQLREKRKKKTEKNDEVWDELDKIWSNEKEQYQTYRIYSVSNTKR